MSLKTTKKEEELFMFQNNLEQGNFDEEKYILKCRKFPIQFLTGGSLEMKYTKFSKLRDDNTIKSPNNLTVKYWVTNKFRVNEWQATLINYGLTLICGS